MAHAAQTPEWKEIEARFHGQYFEFAELQSQGLAWMAADPLADSESGRQNKARILAIIEASLQLARRGENG